MGNNNDLSINIRINSDTKALEITKNGFDKISTSVRKTEAGVDAFSAKLANFAHIGQSVEYIARGFNMLGLSASKIIETADSMNRLDGRLRLATSSAAEFAAQQNALLSIAKETHAPLQAVTDLYIKLDPALTRLGATTSTVNQVTENFTKALKLGGANTQESASAILQFAQAMGSGVLRGEEFNAIAEASPKLMEYLAKGLNVPQGELRKLAEAGELTAGKVSAALLKMSGAIEGDFKRLPKTVGDAITDMQTGMAKAIGEIDKASGITAAMSSSITDMSASFSGAVPSIVAAMQTAKEYKDEMKTAAVVVGTFYGVTLLGTGITALREINIATKAATTAQLIFNTVTKANPWVLIASSVAVAAGALYEYKTLLGEVEANNAKAFGQKAFSNDLKFLEGKDVSQQLHDTVKRSRELQEEQKELITTYRLRNGYAYQSARNDKEQADRKARIMAITEEQKALVSYAEKLKQIKAVSTSEAVKKKDDTAAQIALLEKNGVPAPDKPKKGKAGKTPAQIEADELRAVTQRLDLQKSAQLEYYTTIGDYASVWAIKVSDDMQQMAASGMLSDAQMIDVFNAKHNQFLIDEKKRSDEREKDNGKAAEKRIESERSLYASLNELSGNWYDNEIVNISNRAAEFAAAGIEDVKIAEWVSASIVSIDKKRYDEQSELAKKQYEEENKLWLDLLSDFDKAMENQLFDAMVGKWTSFGSWFKDFWSSLSTSVMRALSAQLSTSITGSIRDMLLGNGQGGIQNVFKSYGGLGSVLGFSAPAALAGSNTDAAGFTTTTGGTVFDAAGQITKEGSDVSSVVNALSNTKSLYSLATGGISNSIMSGFSSFGSSTASLLQSMGFTQAGAAANMGISQFGAGLATPWSSAGAGGLHGAGAMLGGAAIGAGGGYLLGSLGDKLFGADTRASTYGAIGGAIGSLAGPLGALAGAAIGSAIGGMFGKKSFAGTGLYMQDGATSKNADGMSYYRIHEDGGWFSGDRDTNYYTGFNEEQKKGVRDAIASYEYLLGQLGIVKEMAVSGGHFSDFNQYLDTAVTKSFLSAINSLNTDSIYQAWADYASTVNSTITEAMNKSVSEYVGTTRSFEVWSLERSGKSIDALKLKSEWAAADTANLKKMLGLSEVTADNYLSRYKEAISNSFDPETLQNYKTLGEQLMNNAEAADAYTQALKDQAATAAKLRPSDMMLSRVSDTTAITGTSEGTVTAALLDAFNKLIRSIDTQNTLAQLAAGR